MKINTKIALLYVVIATSFTAVIIWGIYFDNNTIGTISSGIFGAALGSLIRCYCYKNKPEEERKAYDIEKNDERNLMIKYKSKSKAYDFAIIAFTIVWACFIYLDLPKIYHYIIPIAALIITEIYRVCWKVELEGKM